MEVSGQEQFVANVFFNYYFVPFIYKAALNIAIHLTLHVFVSISVLPMQSPFAN